MIERTGESSALLCESVVSEAPDVPPQQRKTKKTRRGKKKKLLRYEDDDNSPEALLQSPNDNVTDMFVDGSCENEEDIVVNNVVSSTNVGGGTAASAGTTPYEIPEKTKVTREQSKNRINSSRLLRPTEVPKAPENSTQFIIDDHEDCNLYFSFERNHDSEDGDCCASPAFAGFRDIDYEYESPDDLVTTAFYEQDFENIYRHAREDELLSKPRNVILQQYIELEHRVLDLEARIAPKIIMNNRSVIVDPAIMIVQLQEELLRLQEENCALRSEKRTLVRRGDSDGDVAEEDPDLLPESDPTADEEGVVDDPERIVAAAIPPTSDLEKEVDKLAAVAEDLDLLPETDATAD